MTDECDDLPEDEWPNDDEANDIILAYETMEDPNGSGSGCAGVVLVLTVLLIALLSAIF